MEERAAVRAIEVSPQSMALAQELAKRVASSGKGAALIMDYGQDRFYQHSLQGIRDHKFVGLLETPGSADLSAHVDFQALRYAVTGGGQNTFSKSSGSSSTGTKAPLADFYGPVSQTRLLLGLGMEARLQQLLQSANEKEAQSLIAGFRRLVGNGEIDIDDSDSTPKKRENDQRKQEGMGAVYKAACIVPHGSPVPVVF